MFQRRVLVTHADNEDTFGERRIAFGLYKILIMVPREGQ